MILRASLNCVVSVSVFGLKGTHFKSLPCIIRLQVVPETDWQMMWVEG